MGFDAVLASVSAVGLVRPPFLSDVTTELRPAWLFLVAVAIGALRSWRRIAARQHRA
jgi:hypothetical protein